MFWHHDEISQPSSSSATTMTPSHGARETSLIRDDFWFGPLDPPIARMSTIQIRPASVSATRSHWASAISRHHRVTLSRGGRPRATAVPSAAWASSARERAAARTVRDQGSGSEPPTSLANTLIALSMSGRCA